MITNRINFHHLKGDLFGGVTAAVIALPMALAFVSRPGQGPLPGSGGRCWWDSLRPCSEALPP